MDIIKIGDCPYFICPYFIRIIFMLLAFSVGGCSSNSGIAEDPSIEKIFSGRGMTGTMVIASLEGRTKYVHNSWRANQRFSPASTFKILNTLIALEEGVVADEKETIKWDGITRNISDWNQDMTLEGAFKYSCVPVFQGFAEKIGADRYQIFLDDTNYGNRQAGTNATTFWLDGTLTVSATEQIDFLRNIVRQRLPFKERNFDILRKVMVNEVGDGYTIYAKTGWFNHDDVQYGWFVGYVESHGNIWLFAMNIDTQSAEDLKFRKMLTIEALKAKGII